MNTNFAYTDADILQVVEYRLFYPEDKTPPTIASLLENIPREEIVTFVQAAVNVLINASIEDIKCFFYIDNVLLKETLQERYNNMKQAGVDYIFATAQTPVELLKHAFSIKYIPSQISMEEKDDRFLRAMLLINENLHIHENIIKNKDKRIEACSLVLANSFSQKGFNSENYNQSFRVSYTKSIDFFEYASNNDYFKPIYKSFITKLEITSYREYIKTILGLFAGMQMNANRTLKEIGVELWMADFPYIKEEIQEGIISKKVLDFLSIDIDEVVLIDENEDYRSFRSKPLIKRENGTYAVYNLIFLFERLFNSLYFDFKAIADDHGYRNFGNEYKEKFFEETLLHKYISRFNANGRYFGLTGKQAKQIKQGSEPDYYLRDKENNNVILFEHKDIKIRGDIKQSRDLEKIITEYKNKALLVTENHGKKLSSPTPIGVGQLVNLIKKIKNKAFVWDTNADTNSVIYPVLVLTDSNIIPDGLAYLMNEWFYDNLTSKGVSIENVKPLIVMEVSTLLLYSKEFNENGLEHYFELYYKMINNTEINELNNLFLSLVNMSVSFSDYMINVYPKDFLELSEEYNRILFNR